MDQPKDTLEDRMTQAASDLNRSTNRPEPPQSQTPPTPSLIGRKGKITAIMTPFAVLSIIFAAPNLNPWTNLALIALITIPIPYWASIMCRSATRADQTSGTPDWGRHMLDLITATNITGIIALAWAYGAGNALLVNLLLILLIIGAILTGAGYFLHIRNLKRFAEPDKTP